MGNVATKFGLGSGGGVHFQDPKKLWRALETSAGLTVYQVATARASSTANFFTEMALRGVADDTNWSADTYKTILSIASGAGLMSHFIGPTGLGLNPTTTIRITVDGVLYNPVAVVATSSGQRAVFGACAIETTQGAWLTGAGSYSFGADTLSVDKTTPVFGSSTFVTLPDWATIRLMGTPCIEYTQSLLVEAKSSEINSTTGAQQRQCGVQYMVFS